MFETMADEVAPADATDVEAGDSVAGVLAAAVQRRRTADRAEAELLALAAVWADLHPVVAGAAGLPVEGMERLVPLAGDGTPEVAEFAPAELGAALGVSTRAAGMLVGDALELRHRLPRLWARVQGGDLPAWRARKIAEHTRTLSPEAAAWVDAQLAAYAHKVGLGRILAAVEAAILRFDPERAAAAAKASQDARGVWASDTMTDGTRTIHIQADALDVTAFDQTVGSIADTLAALGDTDLRQVRRAKAIGVIADPQHALDLLTTGSETSAGDDTGGAPAPAGRPKVVLYVHLHRDAITGHTAAGEGAVGRVEGFGPVLAEQLRDWVGRADVKVRPVLDLDETAGVDAHEAPARMREQVLLRDTCCPFPWCTNQSRHRDLDHIDPYRDPDGLPEAAAPQTRPGNLAALCRRHHRLKTHSGWSYTMVEPGHYLWRSPHGHHYYVDPTGTRPVDDPAGPAAP